jgi:hypothetical protein
MNLSALVLFTVPSTGQLILQHDMNQRMQIPGIHFLECTPVWDNHPASHKTANNIFNFVLPNDEQGQKSQPIPFFT